MSMMAASAISPQLLIAEWTSSYHDALPRHRVSGVSEPISIADGYARLVTDRWVYVVAETATVHGWQDLQIVQELYVDAQGKTWVTTAASPHDPIEQRGDPVREGGKATHGFAFRRLGPKGHAVWLRLLLSRSRLPSTAIRQLEQIAKVTRGGSRPHLHPHVVPLWDWRRYDSPLHDVSALVSKDGWSLVQTPLWLTVPEGGPFPNPGTPMRVAVGIDPFTIAKARSQVYVRRHADHEKVYEPDEPPEDGRFHEIMLARLINDTIVRDEASRARYGQPVHIGQINDALDEDDQRRRAMVKDYEAAALELAQVLDSALFRAYVRAGMSAEGIDPEQRSEPLALTLRVLARCTRRLGLSRAGTMLLRLWADESEADPDHFTNHIILPTIEQPPTYYFKTFRWSSKAIASILAEYAKHKVAVARIATQHEMAEKIVKPFAKLGWLGGSEGWDWYRGGFDPKRHIVDVGVMSDYVKPTRTELKWFSVEVHHQRYRTFKVDHLLLDKQHAKWIERWIQAGTDHDFGRTSKLLSAKLLFGIVLDSLNLALALEALVHQAAQGRGPTRRAIGNAGMSALGLTVALVEAYVEAQQGLLVFREQTKLHLRTGFAMAQGLVNAYFAVADAWDALEAFKRGDNDRALALSAAAAAEIGSVVGYALIGFSHGISLGPWVAAIAAFVAVAAHVVAALVKDEPLETFLERCAWGRDPYAHPDQWPEWSEVSIGQWRQRFAFQQRLLFRLIARFTVSQVVRGSPVNGIEVELSLFAPTSTVTVRYSATAYDGSREHDEYMFSKDQLPPQVPGTIRCQPSRTLHDYFQPSHLEVEVRFRFLPELREESVTVTLREHGRDLNPDPKSNLHDRGPADGTTNPRLA